jgi:hypothetical protein
MFGYRGSAPAPFDALDGPRLAGPDGSHPLRSVRSEELVTTSTGAVEGDIVLDGPARVGDGIEGSISLRALQGVDGRAAHLRLVGLRLDEQRKSIEHRDKDGRVTSSTKWVEAEGTLFVNDRFVEPVIPASLQAGATWSGRFAVPAPRLGPPTAHLGESLIAWALQVHWDIARAPDEWIAVHLPIAQHAELLRAGVGRQGGPSLLQSVTVEDAVISVTSELPATPGGILTVSVRWPSAPTGRGARIELHRHTTAPNGETGIIASVEVPSAGLVDGSAIATLAVPADAAPSFDGAGLQITYVVRVLVDLAFRPDVAVERPVAIA